jgi:hypothetical protein
LARKSRRTTRENKAQRAVWANAPPGRARLASVLPRQRVASLPAGRRPFLSSSAARPYSGNAMPTIAHWLIIGAIIIGTGIILAFALHVSLLR